jgi:ketosteroid isomerase-like protein
MTALVASWSRQPAWRRIVECIRPDAGEQIIVKLRILTVLFVVLPFALGAVGQSASDEDRVRSARAGFNAAIAHQDVAAIVSFLDDDYQITTSLGDMFRGRDSEAETWADLFASREDVIYVRSPDTVVISESYPLAAESGNWRGSWSTTNGMVRTGGSYAAMWRKVDGEWKVRSELFVALFCEGTDCP